MKENGLSWHAWCFCDDDLRDSFHRESSMVHDDGEILNSHDLGCEMSWSAGDDQDCSCFLEVLIPVLMWCPFSWSDGSWCLLVSSVFIIIIAVLLFPPSVINDQNYWFPYVTGESVTSAVEDTVVSQVVTEDDDWLFISMLVGLQSRQWLQMNHGRLARQCFDSVFFWRTFLKKVKELHTWVVYGSFFIVFFVDWQSRSVSLEMDLKNEEFVFHEKSHVTGVGVQRRWLQVYVLHEPLWRSLIMLHHTQQVSSSFSLTSSTTNNEEKACSGRHAGKFASFLQAILSNS